MTTSRHLARATAALLFTALLAAGATARAGGAAAAARLVSGLYPGATVRTVERRAALSGDRVSAHQVLPIKRGQRWGYAENAQVLPIAKKRRILVFELMTAAIERRAVAAFARDKSSGPTRYRELVAAVLLDAKGGFVAKPAGFPLSAEVDRECLGDMCVGQGLELRYAIHIHNSREEVYLELRRKGRLEVVALSAGDRELEATKPLRYSRVEDLTGCGLHARLLQVSRESMGLRAVIRQYCNPASCPEMCKERGIQAPADHIVRSVPLER